MRTLGIDTSGQKGSLGLIDGSRIIYQDNPVVRPGGAERFPALIEEALTGVGWDPHHLELVVVGKGPGSYTGVRVGLTIAKGLAFTLGIPLVGISTLYALAAKVRKWPGLICPILESRKNEVYAGLYQQIEAELEEVSPPGIWEITALCESLAEKDLPLLLVGEGVERRRTTFQERLGSRGAFGAEPENLIQGAVLARCGLEYWQKTRTDEVFSCLPVYLRKTEAEIRWAKKEADGCGDH